LETTSGFRSELEVEELWDAVIARLSSAIRDVLAGEKDPDTFLRVKECLIGFVMTLEVGDCICFRGTIFADLQNCSLTPTPHKPTVI